MTAMGLRPLLIILAFLLVLRAPFLNQAIQGDDIYYLAGAQHAQIDPLHPNHARYAFVGRIVDMRGHPHPPLNAWSLAALLANFGDVHEVPFHAAYLIFSLIAAYSVYSLALRFTPHPLLATLLFMVTPAFVVNGTSFESDLPFLAFWLLSIALLVRGWAVGAAIASCLAMMAAYQAFALIPICAVYLWLFKRTWKAGWLSLLATPITFVAFQLFERMSTGELPAQVLAGYFETYGLQQFVHKLENAASLTAHLGWIVFPALAWKAFGRWHWALLATLALAYFDMNPLFWASAALGVVVLIGCIRKLRGDLADHFLAAWVLLFFLASLALFFAGSARYLLPLAAPVALLAARNASKQWLGAGIAAGAAVSLSLAVVNYQHWDGYRQFAKSLTQETTHKRVWINGEWGLRYYFEVDGGLPMLHAQAVSPGDVIVSSKLAYPVEFNTGGGIAVPLKTAEITSTLPFRMIALGAKSGWSTATMGQRPFDIRTGPIDVLTAQVIVERKPEREYLKMGDEASGSQLVSGVYQLEGGQWRWMAARGVVLLKPPAAPTPITVKFYIPDKAPGRTVTVSLDGTELTKQTYSGPGVQTIKTAPATGKTLTITIDKTMSTAADQRELGMILTEAGFAQ